ncbi:membrane protein [Mycobacterium phage GodPhather]|uniref:Membrane protein n=1 Tax=Mycobacterium phage Jeon TaxID=2108123 RepID=A0A2P1JRE4_9CAUD|nr:membrane protein [Mycobacterium phage Jeon]AVO21717.1 membrane protein [Mycobacterium phage Jeon]QBP32588.1 membrane protein [Mycobacterium phage GodPhather]
MTESLLFSLLGSAGFLVGVAGLLSFWNTRKPTREKSAAEAYQTWRSFMAGATDDRDREHQRVVERRDQLYTARELLINLVIDALELARKLGAPHHELEKLHDRLDDARKL